VSVPEAQPQATPAGPARYRDDGARYHGVPDVRVAGPAAHIAALGEFLRVVRG
jgi:hypothetical protein